MNYKYEYEREIKGRTYFYHGGFKEWRDKSDPSRGLSNEEWYKIRSYIYCYKCPTCDNTVDLPDEQCTTCCWSC